MKNFNAMFGFPKRGINFKLLLTFKSLNDLARPYIEVLLVHHRPTRPLCSANKGLLVQPKYNFKTYCDRTFSHAAPKMWNSMPVSLHMLGAQRCQIKN